VEATLVKPITNLLALYVRRPSVDRVLVAPWRW